MAFLGKLYKMEKQENYDEYVESFGLPEDKKSFLLSYKPNQKIVKDGDTYTHYIYINGNERKVEFKEGEEFDTTLRDIPVKTIYTVDGNVVTHVLKFGSDGDIVATIKKEYSDDKMEETITNNKWDGLAKRYYSAEN